MALAEPLALAPEGVIGPTHPFIVFRVDERPRGSPGRGDHYNLREVLGLGNGEYRTVMDRIEEIAHLHNIPWNEPLRRQNRATLRDICQVARVVIPHFRDFDDVCDPNWPILAFLQVLLRRRLMHG
ncbi:hypothetical protein FRC12_005961 [Ceratobasidium sp. 428]|nr:hypothetical protein FRC09_016320 [Ceratobasidium sp. 395]KAG8767887.1 hypothetical protein FRC12_005961 [Ceratobasidium sp. 428]